MNKTHYRCPICYKTPLILLDGKLDCGIHKFEVVQNLPILLDNNSNKYISYNKYLVKRKSNYLRNKLRKIIFGNQISKSNYKFIANELLNANSKQKILIIGGGALGDGIEAIYNSKFEIDSFDIYLSENINFVGDAHNIPIIDNYYDLVIVQAVLEHVLYPEVVVNEITRLVKVDGLVYAETPFLQSVHEAAYDYTRFTSLGHRMLFNNFEVVKFGPIDGAGNVLLWSIEYLFRSLFRSVKIGKLIKVLLFWLKYIDILIKNEWRTECSTGSFFIGKKIQKKLDRHLLIKDFKGPIL